MPPCQRHALAFPAGSVSELRLKTRRLLLVVRDSPLLVAVPAVALVGLLRRLALLAETVLCRGAKLLERAFFLGIVGDFSTIPGFIATTAFSALLLASRTHGLSGAVACSVVVGASFARSNPQLAHTASVARTAAAHLGQSSGSCSGFAGVGCSLRLVSVLGLSG